MDANRAKEIKESPDLINVTFNGDPVYIQQIIDQGETAQVYSLENPDNKRKVSINDLQES